MLDSLQIFLEIVRGFFEVPAVRGDDTIVPGLAGRIAGSRENDIVSILLRGFITTDPALSTQPALRTSLMANRTTVRALFSPTRARANLVLTLPDASTKTISALPLNILWAEELAGDLMRLDIELEGYGDWA